MSLHKDAKNISIISLSLPTGHDDLVAQINALREHVTHLEHRLAEVDGIHVGHSGGGHANRLRGMSNIS